jgi:hypothetical protein
MNYLSGLSVRKQILQCYQYRIWMSKWSAAFGAAYLLSILFLHQTSVEIAICELIALIAAMTVAIFMPANVWRNKRASLVTTLAFVIAHGGIYFFIR